MVNMKAAAEKENHSIRTNGVNQEILACSSSISDEESIEQIVPQNNINGNTHQVSGCNVSVSKGAYPKLNQAFTTGNIYEPTTSRSSCGASTSPTNDNSGVETTQEKLQRKNAECSGECDKSHEKFKKPLKPKIRQACNYDPSSSSEDEECCIYTYKGDSNQLADLPSSFFRLDVMPSGHHSNSRNSSPDMDYLEMDFDPGPSNDRDSNSDSELDGARQDEEEDMFGAAPSPLPPLQQSCEATPEPAAEADLNPPTPLTPQSSPSPVGNSRPQSSPDRSNSSGLIWSPPLSPQQSLQPTSTTDAENESLCASYCYCASKSQSNMAIDENFNDGDLRIMIWKEQEAKEKQATQIETSACGVTAVFNTLLALNLPCTVSAVKQCVNTRPHQEAATVPEFLLSCSNAGSSHSDIIQGLQAASHDLVYARFFSMYPPRSISLSSWLSYWIRKGAVPIVTVNQQRDGGDGWRHQMVHGVSARGVHLTDPQDVQSEARLRPQLSSPAELSMARETVLSRWTPDTDLRPLADPTRPLWCKANVLGQVVSVVREGRSSIPSRSHVVIPAACSSGVTLALLRTSPACDELRLAPELPLDPFTAR